jgi:hypothetical protein
MKDKICLLLDVAIRRPRLDFGLYAIEEEDVAIPSDRNVIQKESEKKLKYKNLSIEIQRMWNMKCFHTSNHWSHRTCN